MKLLSGARELSDGRILEESGVIRSYVKTDTSRPLATPAIRRRLAEAQERIRQAREAQAAACPAARVLGCGAGGLVLRCAVERNLLTEKGDPSSLAAYCLNAGDGITTGYVACPTWRQEKERIWAARKPLVEEHEGV